MELEGPEQRVSDGRTAGDLSELATLLRAEAAGARLTWAQQRVVIAHRDKPSLIVALRHAEATVEGEALVARLDGDRETRHELQRIRGALREHRTRATKRLEQRHRWLLARVRTVSRAPDHLDALVMWRVNGERFRAALTQVLKRRGLRMDAMTVPGKDLWGWLTTSGLNPACHEDALPSEVRKLRQLDDEAFLEMLLADAREAPARDILKHHALVERWAAQTDEVEARLWKTLERVSGELVKTRPAERDAAQTARLDRAAGAYARACAQSITAMLTRQDLHLRVVRSYHRPPLQRLRFDCLNEAAAEVARADPELAAAVETACAKHRAVCLMATSPHPCADCVPVVAAQVRLPTEAPADNEDDDFVCAAALAHLPHDTAYAVVTVGTRTEPESSLFGFAWVTDDGELRTGTADAASPHDSAVQAVCRAALDLAGDGSNVLVVTRDASAAAAVQRALRTGTVTSSDDQPLSAYTKELLEQLPGRGQHVSAYPDLCPRPHRGAQVAEHLATLALQAARGQTGSQQVQAEADRISGDLSAAAGAQLISPEEEGEHAWWLARSGADESVGRPDLVWQTALYRMHLDGGWCVLPDGPVSLGQEGQRLRLRIKHRDRRPPGPDELQAITLRRRGGQWELHGIHWPATLLPGVLVTFTWRADSRVVNARTALLPQPERIDETEYLHRYDPQVVTREMVPGADQDRDVPDLADTSWVLRALRKLGYLAADGSAILSEDALVRNCLELGMPRSRLDRLPRAVEQLLRSGRVEQVVGSLDQDGRPWCPPRPGQIRADLLRYVPQVRALDPSLRREIEHDLRANRRGHWVTGFVRRLPPGARASAEQIDAHREAVYAAKVVDRHLPEGYTYVRRHRRGQVRRRT